MAQANAYSSGVVALTGSQPTLTRIPIRPDRYFLATALTNEVAPTGRFLFTIGSGKRRQTMFHGNTMQDNNALGDGNEPFYLWSGFLFLPRDEILLVQDDTSGSTNTPSIALHGYDLTRGAAEAWIRKGQQHVSYSFLGQTITSNGASASIGTRLRYRPWRMRALTVRATSDFDVQVQRGDGVAIFDLAVRQASINGTPQRPADLHGDGWPTGPNGTLLTILTSRAAGSNTITIGYHGEEELDIEREVARLIKAE